MSDLDPEILVEFLIESRENLDQMERELVVLERDPAAATALNAIFRAIHTIKGTAGFLGLDALQRLTHVGETLLSRLRDRELVFTPALASLQLRLVDAVRAMLAYIEANGSESPEAYLELAADLAAASESDAAPAPALAPPQVAAPLPVAAPPPVTLAPPPPPPPASIIAPPPAPAAASPAPAEPARPVATDTTVRVDVGLLDQLVNLAGELVLARNRLTRYASTWLDPVHLASWQRLHQISSQLQEQVMKTRMQPIGTTWAKLPRTVRDLATQCGKQVRLELEGGETEFDRTLLEAIRDPMTHALRNAIDHGIEPPTERLEACKEPEGVIRLRAYHDSGQVHIELSDDGAGIRPAKVKAKAIERGVISADAAERMSDAELIRLVFRPGFSTAETVTSVSGRGVGMDVVRSNIEKIGGQVDIASVAGEGTTLHIAIPLTLAILPALIVESGGERYAIPQAMLRELVRVDADHPIEHVHAAPVFRLRGRLLPLIDLARAVGAPASPAPQRIMVLSADGHEFGVLIDRYHDTEEIVVKPLGRHLRDVGQYGGATILGDGRVVLIVDCRAIARDVCRQLAAAPAAAVPSDTAAATSTRALVLLRQGPQNHFAVPLEMIERIASVAPTAVTRTGPDEVVQVLDDLIPVMRLGDALGTGAEADDGEQQLIVVQGDDQRIGVAVDQIIDIVTIALTPRWSNRRPGVTGTVVVDGKVIELLDLPDLIEAHAPHLLRGTP